MKNKQFILRVIFLLGLFLTRIQAQNAQEITNEFLFGKYYTMNSQKIGEEREFFISVPDNYNNSDKIYPVLYMMDRVEFRNWHYRWNKIFGNAWGNA